MSYYVYNVGIKIYLPVVYTQNESIGLYTTGGHSFFAWAQTDVQGASNWKSGILADRAISSISQSVDLKKTGGTSRVESVVVKFTNIISNSQFWTILQTIGIDLHGLYATIYELRTDIELQAPTSLATAIYYGKTEEITWNETTYEMTIVDPKLFRNKKISSKASSGKNIPICIGTMQKVSLVKTENTEYVLTNKWFYDEGLETVSMFPVIQVTLDTDGAPVGLICQLKDGGSGVSWSFPENLYVEVVEGNGTGQRRKVTAIVAGVQPATVQCQFDPMESALHYEGDNQSVVRFVDVTTIYSADSAACGGFLNDSGSQTTTPAVYKYENDMYNRISDFALTTQVTDNKKNKLKLDYKMVTGGNIDGVVIVPASSVALCDDATLSNWSLPGYRKLFDGWYCGTQTDYGSISLSEGSLSNTIDKNYSTRAMYRIGYVATNAFCLIIKPPAIPESLSFDKCYIGIKYRMDSSPLNSPVIDFTHKILWRRFFGESKQIWSHFVDSRSDLVGSSWTIDNLPDFYYTPTPSTGNKNFYFQQNSVASSNPFTCKTTGFKTPGVFEINGIAKSNYGIIDEIALILDLYNNNTSGQYYADISIYEIAFIFAKSDAVGGDVIGGTFEGRVFDGIWEPWTAYTGDPYKTVIDRDLSSPPSSPVAGDKYLVASSGSGAWSGWDSRVAVWSGSSWYSLIPQDGNVVEVSDESIWLMWSNSAWRETRRQPTATVSSTVDVLEMSLRMQRWADPDGSVDSPMILGGSADGGFDNSGLAEPRSVKYARQFVNEIDTAELISDVCRSGWLVNYVNSGGYEEVKFLLESSTPSETILFTDIKSDIGIGDVEEPRLEDVFTEPYVNYDYDEIAGTYKTLSITNTDQAAFSSSYVSGFTTGDTDAAILWSLCQTIRGKFKNVEPPPSELTDRRGIYRYDDAKWYLTCWIFWMGKKRIKIPVSWEKGRLYTIGMHVYLNLPHQTNGTLTHCVIEAIVKNIYDNFVEVRLIIL